MQTGSHWRNGGAWAVLGGLLLAGLAGSPACTDEFGPGAAAPSVDGNAGLDQSLFPTQRIAGEPNDSFADALEVIFDGAGIAQLAGTISDADDVDIFAVGALAAGDRIIIDVAVHTGKLDAMVAVFDERGAITFENDDRNLEVGLYDPFLNEVIRHDSSVYFLAIARAPLGSVTMTAGAYEVLITVVRGGEAPVPAGQILALNFEGGTVEIPYDRTYQAGPFDTADIASAYKGMTGQVRNRIVETIEENYEGLALDVRVLPGDSVPPGACTYSTLYFGARSPEAFGISQQIDPYNQDPCDVAIVFTEMFTPFRFGRVLSADELGIAIGNVASHELGHLLGLNHVADVYDLMDTTGSPDTFYLDQDFTTAPLDESVFPLGIQDGFLWLLETLGPAL